LAEFGLNIAALTYLTMVGIASMVIVSTLILLTIMQLNIIMIHADSSDLSYCANGEGKDGIKVKICSVDKEKCEKNAKENDISASCNKMH
jgi:hypothetical protein